MAPDATPSQPPVPPPEVERWPAFFQRSSDPLFLLSRTRRLVFVNRAFETLTGVSAAQARGLICRRGRPPASDDPIEAILAQVLAPPAEALAGQCARARRLLPGVEARRWWDVEFFPLRKPDGVLAILGRVLPIASGAGGPMGSLPEKLVALRERRVDRYALDTLTSRVPAARRLRDQVRLAAQVATPVLLVGEPGTGKHWLARAIHYHGPMREMPLALIPCGRLPASAVAALLFGDGAEGRRGHAGAVYLKEPGRLPRDLQLRLLERLASGGEEGRFPRVLASCCTPPADEVKAGRLLEELHQALAVFVIQVPPLRDRRDDLPWLVERMLPRLRPEGQPPLLGLSPDAWEVVLQRRWPGNIRELFDVLSAAAAHTQGERVGVSDLPTWVRLEKKPGETAGKDSERQLLLDKLLESAEKRLIELALRRSRGNKTKAADLLGVWRPRLLRRMKALGIADPEGGDEGIQLEIDR